MTELPEQELRGGTVGEGPDKTLLHLRGLATAKTRAEELARTLVSIFEDLAHHREGAAANGVVLSRIEFSEPVLQAAWERYERGERGDPLGPPSMATEDELVARVVDAH